MIAKLADAPEEAIPAYYPHSIRPWLVDHVNGAYLAATREVWQRISPLWLTLFNDTWNLMNDSQPPTDQLPLAVLLTCWILKPSIWANGLTGRSQRKIGGQSAVIPPEVVGAHGGFSAVGMARNTLPIRNSR